jgi:hypothetical protein
MIKLQDLTPEIYYKQSRDFQFIGRLYDVVLNYVKTNATNLYNLPIGQNMDEQLLNLLALTLGFKPTKHYNSKQLLAICSALPIILKHKGSIEALALAANALLTAEGIKQPLDYTVKPTGEITLYVAQELTDLSLLMDLFDYLLPAGVNCEVIKESQAVSDATTTIHLTDTVRIYQTETSILSRLAPVELRHELTDLAFGMVGDASSILPNVSIVPGKGSLEGE